MIISYIKEKKQINDTWNKYQELNKERLEYIKKENEKKNGIIFASKTILVLTPAMLITPFLKK